METTRLDRLLGLLKDSPEDAFLLYAIAKEYESWDQWDDAIRYYQRLCKEHPNYVGTYYHYGKLMEKEEEFEEALVLFAKGMEVAKKAGDQHAYAELANAKTNLEIELE